jgi:hypothetical protein
MRKWFRHTERLIAGLLIAALFLTFPLRPVTAIAIAEKMPAAPAPGPARRAERQEAKIEQQLLALKRTLRAHLEGRATDARDLAQAMAAARQELSAQVTAMDAILLETEQDLRQRGLPAVATERYQAFTEAYRAALADLEERLDVAEAALAGAGGAAATAATGVGADSADLTALLEALDQFTPSDRPNPLGAELPHGLAAATSLDPRTQGATSILAGAPATEDTAETPETRITPEIQAKASELGHDPVRIYEFVRNEIRFEPYGGSRKGAAQTLAEGRGNDWDQASLLIALLRAAGVPARYTLGTVELSMDQLQHWVGVQGARPAVELLTSSGMPAAGLTAGGQYVGAILEHVWVSAWVEVADYRGLAAGDVEKDWVPLDPSFKQVRFVEGIDLSQYPLPTDLGNALKERLWIDPNQQALANLKGAPIAERLDALHAQIQQDLLAQGKTEISVTELLGGTEIIREEHGLLPFSLPYRTVALHSQGAAVPASQQTQVDLVLRDAGLFGLPGAGAPSLSYRANLAELYGSRLTLTYRPATAADAQIVSSYGSLIDVPPYLVKVVPQVVVDGHVVAEGAPTGLGTRQQASVRFLKGTGELSPADYQLMAGGVYSLVLDHGGDLSGLADTAAEMANLTLPESYGAVMDEAVMGPFLHAAGRMYWAESGVFEAMLAQRSGVVQARQPRAGVVGFGLSVGYLFFSPSVVDPGSLFFDIRQNTVAAVSHDGDREMVKEYMLGSGLAGSALEHAIWEQLTGLNAVSSVKLLSLASELAIPIYTLDQDNVSQVLPTLDLSDGVKAEIQSAVARGRQVVVPGQMLEYGSWQGAGYIVFDPETGAAGYMIQGGLAGGSTSLVMDILVIIAAIYLLWVLIPATIALLGSMMAGGLLATLGYGLLAALNLAYIYSVISDLRAYFSGDAAAGERIIFGALLMGALQLVAKAIGAIRAGGAVNQAFTALDSASGGAASQLLAQGLTKAEVVAISQGVELRALVNFVQRYGSQLPPGFLKSIPQLISGGNLSAGNIFRSQFVTVNLAKLSQAMAQLQANPANQTALRTIDGVLRNLVAAHTELMAEGLAVSKGFSWLLPRTHINISGIDMAARLNSTISAIEVKGSTSLSRVFTAADLSNYITVGANGRGVFDVAGFLSRVATRPDVTAAELQAIRSALNGGTFEFWVVINSANSGAVGADLVTMAQQGLTYTAPNNTTQVMKFIIEHIWR